MQSKLTVINTIDGILGLGQILSQSMSQMSQFVAFDVETTGLTQQDTIIGFSICLSEEEAFYVILANYDKHNGLIFHDSQYLSFASELFRILQNKQLIMHNGVFDCMMVESNFKIKLINNLHTDTMILAHLLDENRKVGLKELSSSMYGESSTIEAEEMKASVLANGGVITKKNYEMWKADSQLLAKYGAKDALLTFRLFQDLLIELDDQGLYDFFYNDESMPLLRECTYDLNTTGIQVDIQRLNELKATLTAECAEHKAFVYKEIESHIKDKYPGTNKKNQFNVSSNQMLSWLLYGAYGLEFGTLTPGGKTICKALGLRLPYTAVAKRQFIHLCETRAGQIYQPEAIVNGKKIKAKLIQEPWKYIGVDKRGLAKLAPKHKWIAALLEYQKKNKLLNTYVKGMESRIQYGILKSSYLQHGTMTGRYASRSPNLQNLPRDDQRVKECLVSRPGKVFVSADYSQLEPRTFASYSQDPKLMAAFDGKTDFYSVIGKEVYEKDDCTPQKDGSADAFGVKYKKLRDLSKVIALASAYGALASQLAPTTGKSIEDTAEDMNKYFERFPGVQKMMLEAHEIVKKTGRVTNLFGRIRRIPEAKRITAIYKNTKHADLPYDARKLLNTEIGRASC